MASPNRPVLGEKSTNALVNKQEHGQNTKGSAQHLGTTVNIQLASPLQAGRKRRYHEVESSSFEHARGKQEIARAGLGSQAISKPVIAETFEESDSFMSSMIDSHSVNESCASLQTSTSTLLTSFHASQEPSQPIEEQFEIVQEESQRTLEQIHATPMPEPKFSLPPPDRPILFTEGSQDSVRMSSFIDFDEADKSQQEKGDDMEMITPPTTVLLEMENPVTNQLLEKATMLRTRLQLAMHKVETNQTSKPFSRLEKPKSLSPGLTLPPMLLSTTKLPRNSSYGEGSARLSPESQIAIHRARAFRGAYQNKAVQRLNSLPTPKIVPTAYSARYMVPPHAQRSPSRREINGLPTISPSSHETTSKPKINKIRSTPSPSKDIGTGDLLPQTPRHHLSSPPGSDAGDSVATGRKLHSMSSAALTSSVVKGEAANGLLELMRAGSR